jgi:hypothetical protein
MLLTAALPSIDHQPPEDGGVTCELVSNLVRGAAGAPAALLRRQPLYEDPSRPTT